ncbi:MAG: type II toxin-antitoxin system VapC family toxin [Candidatus Geothermarchaeales archaeon]
MLTIDSNMWAYYFDGDTAEHRFVEAPIENALNTEEILVNTVIIMEVAHYLIKNLGPVLGKDKLDTFLTFPFKVVDLDYGLTLEAIDRLKEYAHLGIGGRDATILAFMKREGTNRIMTHDKALKRVDWLETADPVPLQA